MKPSKFVLVFGLSLFLLCAATADYPAARAEAANGTPPTTLVDEGVTSYALAYPRVAWHTAAICEFPPELAADGQPSTPNEPDDPEVISRIPAYGGLTRTLFYRNAPRPPNECNPYHIYSNIVADSSYVYWANDDGLVRLPLTANTFDAPTQMSGTIQSAGNSQRVELADGGNHIFAIIYDSDNNSEVWRVTKLGFAEHLVDEVSGLARNLAEQDRYVYWVVNNTLRQARLLSFYYLVTTIATDVTGYYAEGERTACVLCAPTDYIFIGQGREVVRYDNEDDDTSDPIYTSDHPVDGTYVYDLVSDGSRLFLLEARPLDCPGCFDTYDQVVIRTPRVGFPTSDLLYVHSSELEISLDTFNLTTHDDYLYWQEMDRVLKLPRDAEALPLTNMTIERIEVTQGIQNINNGVPLIDGRYTYVRVFAQADQVEVAGVTAWLYRVHPATNAILDGPLQPVNTTGKNLTVLPELAPAAEDGAFLFELPLEWLHVGMPLKLQAQLNPSNTPAESNQNDNTAYTVVLYPVASPRLRLQVYAVTYNEGNVTHAPRQDKDIQQTFSWLRRAYPLASVSENFSDPGLQPVIDYISVPGILSRITQTHEDCEDLESTCAAVYLKDILHAWQFAAWLDDPDGDHPIYLGMIADDAGFARGKGGNGVAISPSGVSCCGHVWDTDGAYTDWYAAHEIGHALGRKHPVAGSTACGHSDDDGDYPYNFSAIGPFFGAELGINWGFDRGAAAFGIPRAVYPSAIWRDVMGYCQNQWISDYTYLGLRAAIFDWGAGLPQNRADIPVGNGDFLSIFGTLVPDSQAALLHYVRRHDGGTAVPPLVPGDYAIRLLNSQGNVVAEHAFTPDLDDDGTGTRSFGQIVPFVAATGQVQLVHLPTNAVWGEQAVSANVPTVSHVSLNATSPVSGTATVSWTAVDADGDALSYDVIYSQDSGATFELLALGLTDTSLTFNASRLGGGSTILRVTASDGVLAGAADSPSFIITNQPPQPLILNPADGVHVEWGQLVQFSGEALDWQDDFVAGANLVWSNQYGVLGPGASLAVDDLPVGENQITLQATNSAGLSATTTITVVVEDDLELPGPTLVVGPTALGWHIAPGDPAQTSLVTVFNAGSGNMTWTAETTAPWLTLAVTDDGVPGTLTVTADPTGLAEGESYQTTIVITADPGGPAPPQTMTIPAVLAIGDVYTPPPIERQRLYLPAVVR